MMDSMEHGREEATPEEPQSGLPDAVADALEEVQPQTATTESSLERLLEALRSLN